MRVLLIHNYPQYFGGEETYFESLIELLEKKGYEVIVYKKESLKIKNSLLDQIKISLGLFWNTEIEKELSLIIKKQKPDVAHFNNVFPLITPTAYWVCRKFKIPIVQHVHNYRFMCPKGTLFRNGKVCELCVNKQLPFYSIFYGCYHGSRIASFIFAFSFFVHKLIKTFNLIDRYIFPSEFTQNYYLRHLPIPKKKTAVISYFVKERKVKTIDLIQKKKSYFLYVGRLSEEKGIIQLLEVFKELPSIKLVVIGKGPLQNKVELYRKYRNISIKGFMDKKTIFNYMEKAQCVIISSLWYEVLPFVYLESLMRDTPVLIPDNGNFKLMIKEKVPKKVYFYRFNDFNDLKKKIITVVAREKVIPRKTELFNQYKQTYHFNRLKNIYNRICKQ